MNASKKNVSLFVLLSLIAATALTQDVLAMSARQKRLQAAQQKMQELEQKKIKEQKKREQKEEQQEKRTFKQTWTKVARLKWRELDKKDAWNIFVTTATVGGVVGGGYLAYRVKYVLPAQRAEQERLRQEQERIRQQQEREREEREREQARVARIRSLWGPGYNLDQEDIQNIQEFRLNIPLDQNGDPLYDVDSYGNVLRQHLVPGPIGCTLAGSDCEMEDPNLEEPGFIPTVRNRLLCGHYNFCRACLKEHVRMAVSNGNRGAQIICPHQGCNHEISPQVIRNLANTQNGNQGDNDLVELANFRAINPRTRAMRLLQSNRGNMNLRACHHCFNTFQYNGEQIIHCQNCNNNYCARCRSNDCDANNIDHVNRVHGRNVHAHAIRCANRDRRVAKRCPRCGDMGAADNACNHTTCTQCNYEFCWMCLGQYRAGSGCSSGHCAVLNVPRH